MVKSRKELLLERIQRLENFIYTENDAQAIIKIHQEHLEYLRGQLNECEGGEKVVI